VFDSSILLILPSTSILSSKLLSNSISSLTFFLEELPEPE
jgi:hypothetical protein